jgi:hypothetical protein
MSRQWFLESTKAPGLRFKIVKLDKETLRAELMGDTGVAFERDISGDALAKYGYQIIKVEVSDGPVPSVH